MARKKIRTARGPGAPARTRWRWVPVAVAIPVITAIAAIWPALHRGTPSPADGPIVLISIDTLRADHLPVYGYRHVSTPNIDALAGIGFTIKKDQWFLQRGLHERGWATGGFVSAFVLRKATGIDQGFDTFDSEMPAASPELSVGQVQRDGAQTLAAAERWVDARRDPRFFLFIHFYEPHKPYEPPPRYRQYLPYDGEIAYADELVGRLIDHLKARQLYDRSTIVLLSDHGEGLGDHGEQEHGLFLYQETTHVPLMIKRPGDGRQRRVASPVQHIDLVPTIPPRRHRHDQGDGHLRRGALFAVSLRLERAVLADRRTVSSDPRAARRAVRPADRSARAVVRCGRAAADSSGDAPGAREHDRERVDPGAVGCVGRRSAAARGARLRRHRQQDPARAARRHAARSQRQGRRARGIPQGHRACRRTEISGGDGALPQAARARPRDERRVAAARAGPRATGPEATALYRKLLARDPEMSDVWLQLAQVLVRQGLTAEAVSAYREVIKRIPKDAGSLLGAGSGLLRLGKLDEARQHAELAVSASPAPAHELLARIALARHDRDGALREARLAEQADPTLPMPLYVQGLLAYNQGQYAAALPPLVQAREQMLKRRTLQMNDLNYYIGDSLARLERYQEAEPYLLEEIRVFPHNTRARASLAMLYRAEGRNADAERAIQELLRVSPTADGRRLAERLWTMFGEPQKAAAVKRGAG
ncbi:MAG: hypothetical protein DMF85_04140 [Acidobacteria bacterium]|nr:MAG: hypothetical protein DMF85_04140 [Acidobacteriota bacterium]